MTLVTYVPSDAYPTISGATVSYGAGLFFDIKAALVSGSGSFTVDSTVGANSLLISALDNHPAVKRSGTTSGPVITADYVGAVMAHLANDGPAGYLLQANGPGTVPTWVAGTAGGVVPDASITVKGIGKASVAPASSTNPIFVGTNDPRVTADQAANVASIRTLGTASTQAATGSHQHDVNGLTATGTKDATTFLRGDNTWGVPPGTGGGGSGGVVVSAADPGSATTTWVQTRAGQPVAIRQTVNAFAVSKVVPTVPAVHAGEAWQHLRAINVHCDYPDSWSYFANGFDGVSGRPMSNTWLPYLLTGPGTTKLVLTTGAASLATQGARALFDTVRTRAKEFGDPNDYGTARMNYLARQYGIRMCGIVGDPTQEVTTLANLYNSYLQPFTLTATGVSYPQAAPTDIIAALEEANEPGYNNAALSLQLKNMAAYMVGPQWANVPIVLASLLSMNDVAAWGDQRGRAGKRGRLTHANPHPYPGGGAPDEGHYSGYSRSFYARDQGVYNAPGQPVWVTETGYHTEEYTNDPHPGVSRIAQAAYTLRMYLANIRDLPRGSKTFNYQLIEGWPTHDPGFNHPGEQGFGYVDTSTSPWTVKPAYWVHRAAILLMEDTGATGPLPDADAPVQITAGQLSTTDVLPVYWSDGRFGAWVWDSRVIYDRNAATPRTSAANITVAPYNLTFTVPAGVTSVKLADPVASETTLTTLTPSGGTVTVSCSANNPRLVIFQ